MPLKYMKQNYYPGRFGKEITLWCD